MPRSVAPWAALLLSLFPGPARAQTALAWRLEPGTTFFAEWKSLAKGTTELDGVSSAQQHTRTWRFQFVAREPDAKGVPLDVTILRVEDQTTGVAAVEDQWAKRLVGGTFTVVVSSRGEVRSILGYGALLARPGGGLPEGARAAWSEPVMRDVLGDVFGYLPERPVRPGDRWARKTTIPFPLLGTILASFDYEYRGSDDGLHRIAFTMQGKYAAPDGADPPVRVVKGDLAFDPAGGSFVFHARKGRLVSLERHGKTRGRLTLEVAGKEREVRYDGTTDIRVRIFDEKPQP